MSDRSIQANRLRWSGVICILCAVAIFFGGGPFYFFGSYAGKLSHADNRLFVEIDCDQPYRLYFDAFLDNEDMLRSYLKFIDENGKPAALGGHCKSISVTYDGGIKLIRTFSGDNNNKKFVNQLFRRDDGYLKYNEASFIPSHDMDPVFLLEIAPRVSAKTFARRQFQLSLIFKQRIFHSNPQMEFLLHLDNRTKVNLQAREDDSYYEIPRVSEDRTNWFGGYKFFPNREIYERPVASDYIRVDFEYASDFWKSLEEYGLSALSALLSIGLSIVIDSYVVLRTLDGQRLFRWRRRQRGANYP